MTATRETEALTHSERILALLTERPMTISQLEEAMHVDRTRWRTTLDNMRKRGLARRREDGVYEAIKPGEQPPGDPPADTDPPAEQSDVGGPQKERPRMRPTLSADQEKFRSMLQDCGVKMAQDTITETFFRGDPEDLNHLVAVLEDARAYVPPLQKRMIVRYWASFCQREMPTGLEARLAGEVSEKGGKDGAGEKFIEDIGWKVEKDRDGEWVPRPGGEIKDYERALRWANSMNSNRRSVDDDEPEDEEEGTPVRRRGRGRGESSLMTLLINKLMPDANKADPRDEELKALRERLEQMEKDQQEGRLDRLENMIAGLANRDPMAEFAQMRERYALLEPPRGDGTASPTVTLIQDQTNKIDKNVNRVVGLIERLTLRGKGEEEFIPEEGGTPEEQDSRATRLLKRMNEADRSRELRKDLFPAAPKK